MLSTLSVPSVNVSSVLGVTSASGVTTVFSSKDILFPPSNAAFKSCIIVNSVRLKPSSKLKDALTFGAVTLEPSKQGSTSSPNTHNFEIIASFIMKKSMPVLIFSDQRPSKVSSSSSIECGLPSPSTTLLHSSY